MLFVHRHAGMRRAGAICGVVIVLAMSTLCEPASAADPQRDSELRSILTDMAVQENQFKAGRLHELGMPGLVAVLDELLPDTAEPKKVVVPAKSVQLLIQQLGDESFRVRETATEKLLQLGPDAQPRVVEAARAADPETSWRATRVLRRWEATKHEDKSRYLAAFSVYVMGIQDDQRLQELLRRTLAGLGHGTPDGSRAEILRQCVMALTRSGKDVYTDALRPLLKDPSAEVAVLVIHAAGQAVGTMPNVNYFPSLLLDALQSDREEVVMSAIGYAAGCNDAARKPDVKRRLIAVFQGNNQNLKFQACFWLMQNYDYLEARDYLLEQARSTDMNNRYQALSWLGNLPNRGKSPDEKLLRTLLPLLKDKDDHTRYMAAMALGTYAGEEVITNLIPLLDDPFHIVPNEVAERLMVQPDKKLVRRLLEDSVNDAKASEKVRQQAKGLLERLPQ